MILSLKGFNLPFFNSPHTCVVLLLTLLTACKQKDETTSNQLQDSTAISESAITAANEEQSEAEVAYDNEIVSNEYSEVAASWPHDIIRYMGSADDEKKKALQNFSPLVPVFVAARQSLSIKDSLLTKRQQVTGVYNETLTDPADSAVFRPVETNAWKVIQDYKNWMEAGNPLIDKCPSLLELNRQTHESDKSADYLPPVAPSNYLSHGKFFFLGGAPFIDDLKQDDGTPFRDRHYNPEKRFSLEDAENCDYFLNSVYHFQNVPASLSFGGPVNRYDNGAQEVNGIGSIIHEFNDDIHVFFLTEGGVIPARLISANVKLFEPYGCVSSYPKYTFGCAKEIDAGDILAIYVPYHSEPVTSFTLNRHRDSAWTADVNEDGIADLACVYAAYSGASSDNIAMVLWFVNIDGNWQIIDFGVEPDCT